MEHKPHLKPRVLLVISAPGAGKSTQCAKLAKQFNLVHLSIGEILRQQRKMETPEAKKLDAYMKEFEASGKLMPCDIPLKYLIRRMRANGWNKSMFLVDGFIKSVFMYHYWDQMIGDSVDVIGCLYFQCSEKVLLQRLIKRAEVSQREDDKNPELAKIRIKSFMQNSPPLLKLYEQAGLLYPINAQGTIQDVFDTAKAVVTVLI